MATYPALVSSRPDGGMGGCPRAGLRRRIQPGGACACLHLVPAYSSGPLELWLGGGSGVARGWLRSGFSWLRVARTGTRASEHPVLAVTTPGAAAPQAQSLSSRSVPAW